MQQGGALRARGRPKGRLLRVVVGLILLANASQCPIANPKFSELDHPKAHCVCDRIGATDCLELVEKRGDMKLDRVD